MRVCCIVKRIKPSAGHTVAPRRSQSVGNTTTSCRPIGPIRANSWPRLWLWLPVGWLIYANMQFSHQRATAMTAQAHNCMACAYLWRQLCAAATATVNEQGAEAAGGQQCLQVRTELINWAVSWQISCIISLKVVKHIVMSTMKLRKWLSLIALESEKLR